MKVFSDFYTSESFIIRRVFNLKQALVFILIFACAVLLKRVMGTRIALLFLGMASISYLLFIFREHIDWYSSQTLTVLFTVISIWLAFRFGKLTGLGSRLPITLVAGGMYLAFLFRKPALVLVMALVLILNMFATFNPTHFLRVPGLFKLRDLVLVLFFIPLLTRELIQRKKLHYLFESPVARAILVLLGVVSILVVLTMLRYGQSFNLTFRIARDYFYYIMFFATIYCIRDKNKLNFVLKIVIFLSVLCLGMYIVQGFSGGGIQFFSGQETVLSSAGGMPPARLYASTGFSQTILLCLTGLLVFVKSRKMVGFIVLGIEMSLLIYFLSLCRTGWYSVGVFFLLLFVLTPGSFKKVFVVRFLVLVATLIGTMMILGFLRYGASDVLINIGRERALLGVHDIRYRTGTLGSRFDAFRPYFKYIIRKHPVIGGGFIYPGTSPTRYFPGETTLTGHSALVHLLTTMGGIGVISYILLYLVFFLRAMYIFKRLHTPIYKGFTLSFAALYVSVWTTVLTTTGLVSFNSIAIVSFMLGVTEVMYRVDKEKEKI